MVQTADSPENSGETRRERKFSTKFSTDSVNMPTQAEAIQRRNGALNVPAHPIIPFIEGDGTGPDIWRASVRVFDAAVRKAYGGERRVEWFEVHAGESANKV